MSTIEGASKGGEQHLAGAGSQGSPSLRDGEDKICAADQAQAVDANSTEPYQHRRGGLNRQDDPRALQLAQTVQRNASKPNSGNSELNFNKQASKRTIFRSKNNTTDQRGSQKSQSDFSNTDPALRDALIKSFMVIFTNEKSQHLLLNKDIIDIAFNCLEFCSEISVEAKRNLARLISIIFKFPQVQERIL